MKKLQLTSLFHYKLIINSGVLCLFVLLSPIISAQTQEPQSDDPPIGFEQFKNDIQEIESSEGKIEQYLKMSMRFAYSMPDSIFSLAEEVNRLPGLTDSKKEAYTSFILANAWRSLNKDSVVYYAERSSQYLRQIGDHEAFLNMQNLLGLELSRMHEYIKADSIFKMAISYSLTLEEVEYPVKYIYGNLGSLYSMVGAHGLAIEMYERFLETEDNIANRCNINSKLAVSLMEINENARAIELLTPCLHADRLPPPIKTIVRSNLSRMYQNLGNRDQALKLLKEAAEISLENNIPNLKISNLIRLGDFYLENNEISQADSVYHLLERSAVGRLSPNFQIDKAIFLADYNLAKGEYQSALDHATQAIETAEKFRMQVRLRNIYSIKAKAHEALGELDEAIQSLWLQRELEQKKHDRETERNLAMMSVRYQLQSKEAQLSTVSDELKTVKVRNALIILAIILITLFVIYKYRIYYLFQELQTRNRIARDLHDDLSGTLSSISFFTEAARRTKKKAAESGKYLMMIEKSAVEAKEKINDIIWAIDPVYDDWSVFLRKCKRFAADAFDSKGIDYDINIDDNFSKSVNLELRQNLWLIFKEIINNLVMHSKCTYANITFVQDGSGILLEVKDNGIGFDTMKETDRNGIKNIIHRAAQVKADAKVESQIGEGTKWIIRI